MRYGRIGTVVAIALVVMLGNLWAGDVGHALGQPQEEFVPIDQLPPEDQLPAAPLLVAAYAIVWFVVFGYLWTIWRRLGTVQRELSDLKRRAGDRASDSDGKR